MERQHSNSEDSGLEQFMHGLDRKRQLEAGMARVSILAEYRKRRAAERFDVFDTDDDPSAA